MARDRANETPSANGGPRRAPIFTRHGSQREASHSTRQFPQMQSWHLIRVVPYYCEGFP